MQARFARRADAGDEQQETETAQKGSLRSIVERRPRLSDAPVMLNPNCSARQLRASNHTVPRMAFVPLCVALQIT
jgi:hypothetical protein